MKKLTAVWLMVCMVVPGLSQNTIRGVVKDARDQQPLPGAHVYLEDTFIGTNTNSDGQFVLTGLDDKLLPLKVTFIGYDPYRVEVMPGEDTPIEVLLQRSSVLSQEIVVRATRADARTPSTRTEVSREFLQAHDTGQDLPFLLNLTPSLITSSDAGAGIGYTWMNIRGSDNSRINVTINGIPVNEAESHGVWWVNMPDIVSSVDNLQIQRGVGTSTQGAASFGATISLQTQQLQEEAYGELVTSGGAFNTLRNTVRFGTGLMDNRWAFDGRLSKINSDGYVDRSSSDLKSFYLSAGYYGRQTAVKAIAFGGKESTYLAWNGVPSSIIDTNRTFNPSGLYYDEQGNIQYYDNETDNYQQDHYQLHITHEFHPAWTANTSFHYTYGRGYYEQYRQGDRFRNYGLPNVVIDSTEFQRTDLIRQRWLDNHFYGFTYALDYNSFGRLKGMAGGGYNVYEGDHFGEIIWARLAKDFDKGYRYYDNYAEKKDFNSFVKLNYELMDGLYVFGDFQYRHIVYDFEGLAMIDDEITPVDQRATFDFVNPKTGLLYDFAKGHQAYVFYGISNREPVRRDFTQSSPESRPRHETMQNIEAGYRFNSARFRLGINYYLMHYTDQLVLTGEINDVGGFTRTNIDDSYRMGVELEAAYRLNDRLSWEGNLTLSRNKISEFTEYSDVYNENMEWQDVHVATYKDTDIAFSPSVVGASYLSYNPVPAVGLSLSSKYVSSQYIDNTMSKDRKLDAYFVNDLRLSYRIQNSLFRELEFTATVHNVLDVDYITNAWISKGIVGDNERLQAIDDGYFPQAGRHLMAGLRLRL